MEQEGQVTTRGSTYSHRFASSVTDPIGSRESAAGLAPGISNLPGLLKLAQALSGDAER